MKKERIQAIHGIKVDQNSPAMSHIMYADDLLIMIRANLTEALSIKVCFERYYEWLGQQANPKKANIIFLKNMRPHEKKEFKEILGYKIMRKDLVYLGNTFLLGKNKTEEFQRLKN